MAKQTLVFLLLCFVCTVMGREKRGRMKDPCTVGGDTLFLYDRRRSCQGHDDLMRELDSRMRTVQAEGPTVESFQDLLTFNCGTVKPYIDQCFLRNIRNCTDDQRRILTQVVNQTGFVCQPNSNQVHPYVKELVSRLTEGDLTVSGECYVDGMYSLNEICRNEALTSIGYSRNELEFDELMTLPIQELVPKIQQYMRIFTECTARHFRENSNSCPTWRVGVLMRLRVTPLGNNMTFTQEELLQMFELEW